MYWHTDMSTHHCTVSVAHALIPLVDGLGQKSVYGVLKLLADFPLGFILFF